MTTLTHLDADGNARMVDVSDKAITARTAIARGEIELAPETLRMIADGTTKKGDVIAAARIAGIMAAKRTHELIPLCHPLALTKATLDFGPLADGTGLEVTATVKVSGQTGVEMEAMTAVSVACLTLYDMVKAIDRNAVIGAIRLIEKTGGKSGVFRRT